MYYYIYVLQSQRDGNFYVGFTHDLEKRMKEHENVHVNATFHRRPLLLVYFEASLNISDATHREKYLKTSWGKRYIKSRLSNYLTG
jgi:putative endonuclease